MKYGSIVFDMDGVILDFEGDGFQWKYDAVREALDELGVDSSDMSREKLDKFLGDKGVESCKEASRDAGSDPRETWELVARKTTEARLEKMDERVFRLYPEVREVLKSLESRDLQLGVISNAPEEAVDEIVDFYGLRKIFKFYRGVTGFEDLKERKPHPEHLEMARAELKREPFLYAGDAESDLEAAIRAGMDSAWVKRAGGEVCVEPDYTVNDLSGLLQKIT